MATDLLVELATALGPDLRVIRELAGGSMSRLFVMEDVLLRREVVIKLLPPERLAGSSVDRFRTEMQHAARLQHPHIVPVLSAGTLQPEGGDRVPYYIMPFVRGETLRARIVREGALPPDEVRRILLDVTDALAYAHDMGIAHRDLKPENIHLVGKNALIADFGVSTALSSSESRGPVAGDGAMTGTSAYMAPEQAGGGPDLDQRADIYAVGVVAYELLAGQRPFAGSSIQDLLVAHSVESPIPLEQLSLSVPPQFAAIVMRCLEKRPSDRFASAAELHESLERLSVFSDYGERARAGSRPSMLRRVLWAGAVALAGAGVALGASEIWRRAKPTAEAATSHLASVALLAPEYSQPDSAVSVSVAELVDRISTDLSRIEGLKVVNYRSVGLLFRRGQTPTVKEIGQALGVEHLVVFTLTGDAKRSRIAVQLVEAPTQAQVWVAQYAPDSANLETVEMDVVSRATHALLGPSARLPVQAHSERARQEGAHGDYLAGMMALRRRTPDGVGEAVRDFEQAIQLDSTHVEALGRLATALGLQLSYGYRTTMPSYPTAARALLLAERGVALDPNHGEPIGFLAYIEYTTLAPVGKVRSDFDRAIGMRASEADVAGWHGLMLLREGKIDQSLAESQRALELDPNSSARHLTLALAALGAGRYGLAELEARRSSETEPDLRRPRQVEALAMLMQNQGSRCVPMDLWPHLGVKAMCLQAVGRDREAAALVDSLKRLTLTESGADAVYSDVVPIQELATYYAWTGDAEACLRYLRLAFERSPAGIDLRILQSGVYNRVRNAPGFQQELQRLQDAVWPRVLEEKERLRSTESSAPIAALQENPLVNQLRAPMGE